MTKTVEDTPSDAAGALPLDFVHDHIVQSLQDRLPETASISSDWLIAYESRRKSAPVQATTRHLHDNFFAIDDCSLEGVILVPHPCEFDIPILFQQAYRCLKHGGHFSFATLGPDTLHQIREAWADCDAFPHTHPFGDIHLWGDELARCGFANIIMDADWMILPITGPRHFMNELKQCRYVNFHPKRRRTLTGKDRFAQFESGWNNIQREQGRKAVTLELIFGYAVKPDARTTEKSSSVQVRFNT
ncbi:MAG: hypothetical protein AAF353_00415 [Pseudomonadota bacterium]